MNFMKLASAAASLALAATISTAAFAQTSTWKSDAAHSEVDFTIKHLAVSNVHGRLGHIDATIAYDEKDITKSTVKASIDLNGIDTGESARDNHLKSPDFFDVAKFPTATFESTSVTKGGAGLKIVGNLTIKGITKPITLDVEGPGPVVPGMKKELHTGFSATTSIHRADFGIGSGFGSAVLGDDVKISIDLDVVKQ